MTNKYGLYFGICFLIISQSTLFGNWVAKINKQKISTKEFQEYIDVQKYSSGNENVNIRTILGQEGALEDVLLERYIDQKIVLIAARKVGHNSKNPAIKAIINKEKDLWLVGYYVSKVVDISDVQVSQKELRREFNALKKQQAINKPFNKLTPEEKKQIEQKVGMEKFRDKKNVYKKKLEKKYKVSRKKKAKVVAKVEGKSIREADLNAYLNEQLKVVGVSASALKKTRPDQYKQIRNQALEELIFNQLVRVEIEKKKFEKKPIVQTALRYFKEKVIAEYYVKEKIFKKIKVTEKELDTAFKQNKDELKKRQLTLEQIEQYLESSIRQKKLQLNLARFVKRKKDASVIVRNEKEIVKIK